MSKVFNMVGGGSGKNISSIVITGLKSTDTVTCTKDEKSYTATWDEKAQHWEIIGLPLGTFTVTATNGTVTTTETVLIDIAGVYEITMYCAKYYLRLSTLKNTSGEAYYEQRDYGLYFYASSSGEAYNLAQGTVCDGNGDSVVIDAGDTICVSYSQGYTSNGYNDTSLRKYKVGGGGSGVTNLRYRENASNYTYTFTDADYKDSLGLYVQASARSSGSSWLLLTKFEINGEQLKIWEG